MSMFCFQCQEAAKGVGCNVAGVCGKSDVTSASMDTLLLAVKGLASLNKRARAKGINDPAVDRVILDGLFCTITNANFDTDAIRNRVDNVIRLRDEAKVKLASAGVDTSDLTHEAFSFTVSREGDYDRISKNFGVLSIENEDVRSLKELIMYGLKGIAAYAEHADNLGFRDSDINAFIEDALSCTIEDRSIDELIGMTLKTGEYGVKVMALLDQANTSAYGNPEITEVNIGVRNNPAILISGHDLKDLEELLEQTQGTGVDVYTHSEMLPGHYYPKFKKYDNFVGNYGNAWWKQKEEFESFNGPILFTTNCIVPPKDMYVGKIFTTGSAGWPGCTHIPNRVAGGKKDFSSIIEMAKKCESPKEIETGKIVGGFAHNQVLALADKVVDAVKSGAIKKFVVMAGCDGRMKSREYYTEFAKALPGDTVIMTAGCAKYRYNKLQLGDIGGIPRVLDAGQCNDSYSLAVIALKLKEVFGLEDINDLPIVYNIAWYEQKAVIVLLALLSLGVKNIHLGPTLPAFLSPNVVNVLVNTFGIGGISTVEEDIRNFIG